MTDHMLDAQAKAGPDAILARRYALAFYELAAERHALAPIVENLQSLLTVLETSSELRALLAHPLLPRAQQVAALQAVAAHYNWHPLTKNFLALTAQQRRATLLAAMATAFLTEDAARRGEMAVTVTTPIPLSLPQLAKLTQILTAATGTKVNVALREDKSLLGGFVVQYGSRLVDASLRGRLAALVRLMKEAA